MLCENCKYEHDFAGCIPAGGRNHRSVWTISTKPLREAHFATFPPDLIEPMIKAGTSEKGVCPSCGAAWERIIEKDYTTPIERNQESQDEGWMAAGKSNKKGSINSGDYPTGLLTRTIGWQPSCKCNKEPVPAIVLDPFMGAGTTALVARQLGRNYIGIELKPDYCKIAEKRLASMPNRRLDDLW